MPRPVVREDAAGIWGSQEALTSRWTSLKAAADVTSCAASASVDPFIVELCWIEVRATGWYIQCCRKRHGEVKLTLNELEMRSGTDRGSRHL